MFKRALLVTALTAAFAAPAFADVSISGYAEMDIFARTHQASSQATDPTTGKAIPGSSSSTAFSNETDLVLNFDGSDKLDNGSKLIWRVSQKVATPGTAAWGSREAYIGLTGDWGTFRSGRVFAPSYLALDAFQWGAGNLWEDYGANAVWFKEAVAYTTPNFGGFSVDAVYDLGTKTAQGQTWAGELMASYQGNGLSLAGGYQQLKGQGGQADAVPATATTLAIPAHPAIGNFDQDDAFASGGDVNTKQEFYFAQGNWDIGSGFTVRAGWKHNKWSVASDKAENDQFLIGGAYSWGKNSIALGWQDITNSKFNGEKDNDANLNQFYGQYTYGMSKNTVAYFQARYHKFSDANTRPYVAATWQLDGTAPTGTDNGMRLLVGTWTGF